MKRLVHPISAHDKRSASAIYGRDASDTAVGQSSPAPAVWQVLPFIIVDLVASQSAGEGRCHFASRRQDLGNPARWANIALTAWQLAFPPRLEALICGRAFSSPQLRMETHVAGKSQAQSEGCLCLPIAHCCESLRLLCALASIVTFGAFRRRAQDSKSSKGLNQHTLGEGRHASS